MALQEENVALPVALPDVDTTAADLAMEKAIKEIEQSDIDVDNLEEVKEETEEIKEEEIEEEEIDDSEIEESEEEEKSEQTEQPKKTEKNPWKIKKKFYQEKARADHLASAMERAAAENAQLKEMLNESLNSGTYHYTKSAYADLDKAEEAKRKAVENSDLDALMKADKDIIKSMHNISEIEKWAENEQRRQPVANNQAYNQPPPIQDQNQYAQYQQEMAQDWLESKPLLNPNSPKYNYELAQKVGSYVREIDNGLAQNNRQDVLYTQQYFDAVDDCISQAKKEISKSKSLKNIKSSPPIGGVRNSYGSKNSKSGLKDIQLSTTEKQLANEIGISHEEYKKFILKDKLKHTGR